MDNKKLGDCVENFRNGDVNAFNVIYDETKDGVYALLCSYTKNQDESFDLMQETYITVNKKINTLKDKESVKSWINRIAINKANRYFEKNKREILLSEDGQGLFEAQLEKDEEFLPQELLDSKEKQRIIKDIIDNLPLEQKTAVYLYYFDELSLAEVAEDMQCSEGKVKSRLNYARKKIKSEVDTWEKKGTKLYSTGIPVLLLLLRSQLGDLNMPIENSKKVLEEVMNQINANNLSNGNSSGEIQDANPNNVSNNIKDGIGQTTQIAGKAVGIKAGIAGLAIVAALGSGAVLFNKINDNHLVNSNYGEFNKDITLSIKELEEKEKTIKVSPEISNFYRDSLQLYKFSKTHNYLEDKTLNLDEMIDHIRIGDDGHIYDGMTNIPVSGTLIYGLDGDIKSVIKDKEKLNEQNNITKDENEMINLSNQMIKSFIADQDSINKLYDKLNLIASYEVKQTDSKFLMDSDNQDKEFAKEDLKKFEDYKTDFEKLKGNLK